MKNKGITTKILVSNQKNISAKNKEAGLATSLFSINQNLNQKPNYLL